MAKEKLIFTTLAKKKKRLPKEFLDFIDDKITESNKTKKFFNKKK